MKSVLFLLSLLLLYVIVEGASCPCSNATLCEPIQIGPRKELFAFQLENDLWQAYDWSLVTTMAIFGAFDPQMICKAHENNARVVFAGNFDVTQLNNQTAVTEWIEALYQRVVENFADGVNVDVEDPLDESDAPALTALIGALSQYFHDKNPYYQITYDVAWSPNCIDKRCYDYAGLAKVCDFLVMMDYDMRSQIFGPCIASANSPPSLVVQGLLNFTKLGIPAENLVLGLPWYGYDYPCIALSLDGTVCSIAEVPFRGVNCSDAAGTERAYSDLVTSLANSTTGYQWSVPLQSPWFNYQNAQTQQMHQVWFDDPRSLSIKAELARGAGMRGVSMWTADFAPYSQDPEVTKAFWAAMGDFFN